MDAEQRARELLADEYGVDIAYFGNDPVPLDTALRAITRALTEAQPGWRVVPVECQMDWEPTDLHHKKWICRNCGRVEITLSADGHPYFQCKATHPQESDENGRG